MPQEIIQNVPAGTYARFTGGTVVVPTLTVVADQASPAVGSTVTFTTNAAPGSTFSIRRNGTEVSSGVVGSDALSIATTGYTAGDTMTCRVLSGAQDVTSTGVNLASAALPLDGLSGVEVAFSLRRLRTAYTGSLIRVRRSSDNTEQDIGYDGSGNLDTSALATFVGAGSGFIRTWYDQSGNARNAIQGTAGNQPRIVNSGTLDLIPSTSRPGAFFLRSNSNRLDTGAVTLVNNSVSAVAARDSALTSNSIIVQHGAGTGVAFTLQWGSSTGFTRSFSKGAVSSSGAGTMGTTREVMTGVASDGGNGKLFANGTEVWSGTAMNTTDQSTNFIRIGAASPTANTHLGGWLSELVFFNVSLSTGDRTALEGNQLAYYV
jgi:hypothetical protein